jgi:hypothetical protein
MLELPLAELEGECRYTVEAILQRDAYIGAGGRRWVAGSARLRQVDAADASFARGYTEMFEDEPVAGAAHCRAGGPR